MKLTSPIRHQDKVHIINRDVRVVLSGVDSNYYYYPNYLQAFHIHRAECNKMQQQKNVRAAQCNKIHQLEQ